MKNITALLLLAVILGFATPTLADTADTDPDQSLETVTVTARKVKTNKQDIPAAISAFDGYTLEDMAIDNLGDVTNNAPNINYNQVDNHTHQYSFRGIGGTENMNKVYYVNIDDVTVPYVATDTLLDIERIELLRGSQGALYGSNTHIGLLNVITRDPEFTPLNGEVQLSFAKNNNYRLQTSLDGMVNDKLAFRIALAYESTDGYIENTFLDKDDSNSSDQFTGRAKFVYRPGADNKFTLSIYGDRFDSGFDNTALTLGHKTQNNEDGNNDGSIISPTLKWEHDLGGNIKLTTISNYAHTTYGFLQDWDFTAYDMMTGYFDESFDVFSQEVRISGGDKNSLQWLAGVFARYQQQDTVTTINYGSAMASYGMAGTYDTAKASADSQNLAGYGQLTYRPVPRLELTGAMRLDYEHKSVDWDNDSTTGGTITSLDMAEDWMALSPSASVAWDLTEQQKIYAMVSRGFKAGDYNYVMPMVEVASSDPVDPEYTLTYEIGYKSRHLSNKLEVNADLFYVDWSDLQVDVPIEGTAYYEKLNAADAHSSGVELEVSFRPMAGWTIFGNAGYMFEYKFDDFSSNAVDYSGNKLPYTNEYTVSLGSIFHARSGFFIGTNAAWRGDYYLNPENSEKQEGYLMLNAKTGYSQEKWEISIYGRNLLDKDYAVSNFSGAFIAGAPLTVGVTVTLRF